MLVLKLPISNVTFCVLVFEFKKNARYFFSSFKNTISLPYYSIQNYLVKQYKIYQKPFHSIANTNIHNYSNIAIFSIYPN